MRSWRTFFILTLALAVRAIPSLDVSPIDMNPLGQPFKNAVLPVTPGFSPRFSLFRRQGCPNLTLLCPSGGCCSYDTSCCGDTCCPSGYLCTGGTVAAPCCVAIDSPTNTCGDSNVRVSCLRQPRVTDLSSLAHGRETYPARESTFAVPLIKLLLRQQWNCSVLTSGFAKLGARQYHLYFHTKHYYYNNIILGLYFLLLLYEFFVLVIHIPWACKLSFVFERIFIVIGRRRGSRCHSGYRRWKYYWRHPRSAGSFLGMSQETKPDSES